jgi:hypothetical protein
MGLYMGLDAWCLAGGEAGIRAEEQPTIPVPVIPDGDRFPTEFIPVGNNLAPSPSPNRGISRGESGIRGPLPSLLVTIKWEATL